MTLCRLCGAPIAQCRPDSLHTGVAPELQWYQPARPSVVKTEKETDR